MVSRWLACCNLLFAGLAFGAGWQQLELNGPGTGDWRLTSSPAGPVLYLAGRDKDGPLLQRLPALGFGAETLALPEGADRFTALDGDRLLAFAGDGLYLRDRQQWRLLGRQASLWRGVDERTLHHWPVAREDHLFIPDFEQLHVYRLQGRELQALGSLPVPAIMRTSNESPRYEARKLLLADVNLDGRKDLLVPWQDGLRLFLARADGGFEGQGRAFAPALKLTPPQRQWVRLNDGEDFESLEIRSLETLKDLNGDGLADLVVRRLRTRSLFDQDIIFDIHFGRRTDTGLAFPVNADDQLRNSGLAFGLDMADLNGDGKSDLYTPSTRLGVGKIVSALLTGSVDVDLHLELQHERSFVPVDTGLEASMGVEIGKGRLHWPVFQALDLDGDGRAELAVQQGEEKLALYHWQDGRFKRRSQLRLPLPINGNRVAAVKDGQGRQWLLILPGADDAPKRQRRLLRVGHTVTPTSQP
ncbi:VCBS repeat-containing protein [Gallaecimonas sp. GXIMD4217]|uniref:FG-GAP repeat domain-containing protein n=1 Tax=Gallaecimonas sp. GXIMD4217 TaxID=3131927 RepID=UPI00311AF8A4